MIKKIIFIISIFVMSLTSDFASQHFHGHPKQHEPYHGSVSRHDQNILRSREYRNHRVSTRSSQQFNRLLRYLHTHQEFNIYLNLNFELFDCTYYDPMYTAVDYPVYLHDHDFWPTRHHVWFEVPIFNSNITIEYIDPDDVICIGNGRWLYLRDYYRINSKIHFNTDINVRTGF